MFEDDHLTVLTDAHRRVMNSLENMGIGIMEEVDFPPYRVDLYLPDYHVVVEVDGPLHNKRRDDKRDKVLREEYGLITFRISDRYTVPKYWVDGLKGFLNEVFYSRDERWEKASLKVPWL